MRSKEDQIGLQNAELEARYGFDEQKRLIVEKGYEDVYVGKPEEWTVLDESYPHHERIKKQLEVKDQRLQAKLFDQVEGLIKADQISLKTTTSERIPALIDTKYEK